MQAMNQLLALQAKQSIPQRLQLTQDRAVSLEQARQAAATERARNHAALSGLWNAIHAAPRRFLQPLTGPGAQA